MTRRTLTFATLFQLYLLTVNCFPSLATAQGPFSKRTASSLLQPRENENIKIQKPIHMIQLTARHEPGPPVIHNTKGAVSGFDSLSKNQ